MPVKVGKYIIGETLGEGAFGKVKLGVHEDNGEQVAVKCMDKRDIKAQEMTMNIRREIAIMKGLKHKNIVNMIQVLSSSTKLYIVMELVAGGELFTKILNEGKLPEDTARRYFQSMVDGVDYCHAKGVCHRDLKPENLLIEEETGILKITDFGLSAIRGASTAEELQLMHTQCGSPNYCAPEIISSAKKGYDGVMVDVWACGIILFALLSGYLPFYDDNTSKLYRMIQFDNVKYPRKFPSGAKDLCERILTKDPNRRIKLSQVKQHPWFLVNYTGDGVLKGGLSQLSEPPPVEKLKTLAQPQPPPAATAAAAQNDEDSDEEERARKAEFIRTVSVHQSAANAAKESEQKPRKQATSTSIRHPHAARAEAAVKRYCALFEIPESGRAARKINSDGGSKTPGTTMRGQSIAAATFLSLRTQLEDAKQGVELGPDDLNEGTLMAFEKLLDFFDGKRAQAKDQANWWDSIGALSDMESDVLEGLCQVLEPDETDENVEDVAEAGNVSNNAGTESTRNMQSPNSRVHSNGSQTMESKDDMSSLWTSGVSDLSTSSRRASAGVISSTKKPSGIAKMLGLVGPVHTLETDLAPEKALREVGKILTVNGYQVMMKRGDAKKMKVELKNDVAVAILAEKKVGRTQVSFRKSGGKGDPRAVDDLFEIVKSKLRA